MIKTNVFFDFTDFQSGQSGHSGGASTYGGGDTAGDTNELMRQLAEKMSRVKVLEREVAILMSEGSGGGKADVDVRGLYDQVSESRRREKKCKMQLFQSNAEVRSLRTTLDRFVHGGAAVEEETRGKDSVRGVVGGGREDVRKGREKAVDARIVYLEQALEMSEGKRHRLEKQMVLRSVGEGGGDEVVVVGGGGGGGGGDRGDSGGGGEEVVVVDKSGAGTSRSGGSGGSSGGRGGGSSGRTVDTEKLVELQDEVKRLQIQKRQTDRDIANFKKELKGLRSKMTHHQATSTTKQDRLVMENEEERQQYLIQQHGYETRITKLRHTIKTLQVNMMISRQT